MAGAGALPVAVLLSRVLLVARLWTPVAGGLSGALEPVVRLPDGGTQLRGGPLGTSEDHGPGAAAAQIAARLGGMTASADPAPRAGTASDDTPCDCKNRTP